MSWLLPPDPNPCIVTEPNETNIQTLEFVRKEALELDSEFWDSHTLDLKLPMAKQNRPAGSMWSVLTGNLYSNTQPRKLKLKEFFIFYYWELTSMECLNMRGLCPFPSILIQNWLNSASPLSISLVRTANLREKPWLPFWIEKKRRKKPTRNF